ncbi:MAG: ABC transporter ATP-binding protein [Bdellovibrio sp.]
MSSFLQDDEQEESQLAKRSLKDTRALKTLLSYARERALGFGLALTLMLSGSFVSIVSARFMGQLVEFGLMPRKVDQSIYYSAVIIGLEILGVLLLWFGRKLLAKESMQSLLTMRERCFRHLQVLPLSYYDRQPLGRIVTRVSHDIEGIEEFFSSSLGRLLQAMMTGVVVFVTMMLTDFKLGFVLFLLMLPTVFLISFTKNYVRGLNRKVSKLSARINAKLSEFISGIDVIRSFGAESWSKTVYDQSVGEHLGAQIKSNQFYSLVFPLVSFLSTLPLIGLIWIGGHRVLEASLSIGVFVAFIRYAERLNAPVMTLAREVHVIQQAFSNLERVSGFLAEETEEKTLLSEEPKIVEDLERGHLKGEIVFNHVSMSYGQDLWALKDVSFHIRPGEKIGLVGTTGSGKTTTVSLLARLYEYQEGEIILDGHSLRRYDRNYLRSRLGFVGQEAILFRGSLRDNLSSRDELSDQDILMACAETGLLQMMKTNLLDLDSTVLEGGANLSVGERALVALTRVVLNNPSLMILDEATANIDPVAEKLIHTAVDRLMDQKTCLIIAHRLSTLESCDRLFVFSQGKLVESGPHAELIQMNGAYATLVRAQERFSQIITSSN